MDFALPEQGEGVYEVELTRWLVQPGATVKRGQPLLEVLTDKATQEVPSPFVGVIGELKAQEGQKIKVGEPILTYTSGGDATATTPVPVAATVTASAVQEANGQHAPARQSQPATGRLPVKAAPSVRLMARKLGIDLDTVTGSGPDGRILVEDLTSQIQRPAARAVPEGPPRPAAPRPDYGKPGTRIPLAGLRRTIAERMAQAKRTIPHYSYIDECDVTELVRLREQLRETYSKASIKLTYLAFFVKAAALALKEVPIVNASLDEQAGQIILHDHYHIGVAVATPGGLLVPVVKDADRKDVGTIARDIDRLSSEARAGRSRRDDLRGSTFTVTSTGSIGGLISTPVINQPEVGILGLGKVVKRPVYDAHGQLRPADLIYLSLSFDHRVVDGAVGAAFGNAILKLMQNPVTLLLPERL